MATRNPLLRNRAGPQRPSKFGDENATAKGANGLATAKASAQNGGVAGRSLGTSKLSGPLRPILGEVTHASNNRKPAVPSASLKVEEDVSKLKRSRSASLAVAATQQRPPAPQRNSQPVVPAPAVRPLRPLSVHKPLPPVQDDDSMEVEETLDIKQSDVRNTMLMDEPDLNSDLVVPDSGAELATDIEEPTARLEPALDWPEISASQQARYARDIAAAKATFEDEIDVMDTTMVVEYADDIFEYMEQLEIECMAAPDYMQGQSEITWAMRETLIDWLLQVHLRYHMLPETLWITVNVVDRFLSRRIVSLGKLQLVGITAMFIASKYEEIIAPSVKEFEYMTEKGYTKEEILKGERIILQTLDFKVSSYCSPYSWVRKISKADDYDLQTRTLSKFLTEVTLLDHRFLATKPSLIAAIGMYTARRMLGGDWDAKFVVYSGFTEEYVMPGYQWLLEKMSEKHFDRSYVYKKYSHKRFLKASVFAVDWAVSNVEPQ